MTDIPPCSLCTNPMHQTASGAWVCPICDRNVPRQLTRRTKEIRDAKEKP